MDDFNERVNAFVKHVEQVFIDEHNARGYKFPHPTVETEIRSKWVVLIRRYDRGGAGVYAFIAREDFNNNKTLGPVKKGDIHLPASWKAPAKHARGSIFTNDFGNCAGPYGISYLK